MTPRGEGVVVTGCSSGIGRATAVLLAQRGFIVFASVRTRKAHEELADLRVRGLVPVSPLDLAAPDDLPRALGIIREEIAARGLKGLYGIVNNAGAGDVAPIELLDVRKLRIELEARIVAPIMLVQGLLPLLRTARGRIAWIQTPALIPIPFVASIHACDFAANCIARTLHLELASWGIPSVLVRCGGIRTDAPRKSDDGLERAIQGWSGEQKALWESTMQRERRDLLAFDEKRSDPRDVAEKVCTALCAARPRRAYRAGHLSRAAGVLELLPQPVVDRIMARR